MTRRTELLALAERVEKGETGRQLDGDIALAAGLVPRGAMRMMAAHDVGMFATSAYTRWIAPLVSVSIDAQAALPGRIMCVSVEMGGVIVEAAMPGIPPEDWSVGHAPTEHAARLSALLRAMAEGGE